jgi:hypothetical protein
VSKRRRWRAKSSFYPHPAPLLVGLRHDKQAVTAASSSPSVCSRVDARPQKRAINTRKIAGGCFEPCHPCHVGLVEIDRLGVGGLDGEAGGSEQLDATPKARARSIVRAQRGGAAAVTSWAS